MKIQRNIALIILQNEQEILLGWRQNVEIYPDLWCCPGGHVEEGETPAQAITREALEELGITLAQLSPSWSCDIADCRFHFFHSRHWNGEIYNAEPDKCAQLDWFPIDQLPSPLHPAIKQALQQLLYHEKNRI